MEIRSTSRIPLVLFTHPTSGLECDLSLSNPLAINNTDLLLTYSRIDDRVRPLAFLIKQWSKARGINNPGEGTLSSYAFLLCLIHFLQTRPLPVLPYLQSLPPNWRGENNFESSLNAEMLSSTVDLQLCSSDYIACNTYFLKPNEQQFELLRSGSRRNTQTVGELLVDFFEYFAHKFDFRKDIVSIRNQQNNFTPATPESLTRFAKLVKAEEDCWQLHDRWSIEDPFETFYNVGHVVKGPQMLLIRKEFMVLYIFVSMTRKCCLPNTYLFAKLQRAYALCNRSLRRETGNSLGTICTSSEGSSILPSSVDPGDLISLLLKPAATIIP